MLIAEYQNGGALDILDACEPAVDRFINTDQSLDQYSPLGVQVYQLLKQGIIEARYRPGDRASEAEVARQILPPVVTGSYGDELDWSRTTLSSMTTLYMVIAAAALPLTGRLVDYFCAM